MWLDDAGCSGLMMEQKHINISIKAPYYTLNELTDETERVWLVFHGYGQLAEFFIKKFEGLDPRKNFIIAPQGLSKYYLQGVYGRVGASWMTKEDRLTEIDNQYSYIQSVLDDIGDISQKQLVYFGFSQGTATMGRFAAYAKIPFHKMIVWAGTFPPDTKAEDWEYLTGSEEICYYTSKDDVYFKEEMIDNQKKTLMDAIGREPQVNWYEGGHQVISDIVRKL